MVLFASQKFLYMLFMIFIEVVRTRVIQGFSVRFYFLFEIVITGQNVLSCFSVVRRKIWNDLFVSLLPIVRVLVQSILLSVIWIVFRFSVVYFLLKIFLVVSLSEISLGIKMNCVRWYEIVVAMFPVEILLVILL